MPNPTDLFALIFGVLFSLRHMDVTQRSQEHYPAVREEDFVRWKQAASSAYRLGMAACFGKILLDIVVYKMMLTFPPPAVLRWSIGLSLDIGWIALVVWSYLRIRRAHALAREIGVQPATR